MDQTGLGWDQFDLLLTYLFRLQQLLVDSGHVETYNRIRDLSDLGYECPYSIAAGKLFVDFHWDTLERLLDGIGRLAKPTVGAPSQTEDREGCEEEAGLDPGEHMVLDYWFSKSKEKQQENA